MKLVNRMLIGAACAALLIISWAVAAGVKPDGEKQALLVQEAEALIADKIYVRAIPLLTEAAAYRTGDTFEVEALLKETYLQLIDQRAYRTGYEALLEVQCARADAPPAVFEEWALFLMNTRRYNDGLSVLKQGIAQTGSEALIELYEARRYEYYVSVVDYDDVTVIFNGMIQVQKDGLWGLAAGNGTLVLPCEYEQISTYSGNRAIVRKDGEIYAVNRANNRIALLHTEAVGIGNFASDRAMVQTKDGWIRATGELRAGTEVFDAVGMYAYGYAPVSQNGKWGVRDTGSEWLIPPEHKGIVQDALGICMGQNAVFVRLDSGVVRYVNGQPAGSTYQDAKPFGAAGYAAVCKDGLWGFIDANGNEVIPFEFDDAKSFAQHLAAVKVGELWGYVSLDGRMIWEPQFLEAESFVDGSAPVLTDTGWKFIMLREFDEGATL